MSINESKYYYNGMVFDSIWFKILCYNTMYVIKLVLSGIIIMKEITLQLRNYCNKNYDLDGLND